MSAEAKAGLYQQVPELKATEALRLGSMLIEPLRGSIGDPGGPGCAWAMMLEAAGWGRVRNPDMMITDLKVNAPRGWRWLFETRAPMPEHGTSVSCVMLAKALKAPDCPLAELHTHMHGSIMHLFDAGWTANEIADWLEPFEKDEERRQAARETSYKSPSDEGQKQLVAAAESELLEATA